MKWPVVTALLLFMALGLVMPVHAAVYNLTPTNDVFVSSASATTNFGTDNTLKVYLDCVSVFEERTFLSFNTAGFTSVNLTNVSLVMTFSNTSTVCTPASVTSLRQLTSNFSETNVTWNTQPAFNQTLATQYSQAGTTGQQEIWNSQILSNYTIANLGSNINLGFYITTGDVSDFYGSKEGNPNFIPVLVLSYNGTGGGGIGGGVSPVNITQISYPSPFATLGQNYSLLVAVHNIGNFTSTYKIGLSFGKDGIGYCNSACYIGGYYDAYTGTYWFGSVTINPDETGIVSLPYRFRSDFFALGQSYDLKVTVRPIADLTILDNRTIPNAVTIVNFPTTTSAKIVNVTLSDYNPTVDQTITASIRVMNNGTIEASFPIGFSIGKDGVYCNRDCYTDCSTPPNEPPPSPYFCDYVSTGILHPNQTVTVSRQFKFDQLNFEVGQTYDVIAAAYYFPYSRPDESYDYRIYTNAVNISDFTTKLAAYASSATITPKNVQISNVSFNEDTITVDIYVVNNATFTYNYTIGVSIGYWNATNKGVYYTALTPLIPPCNKLCYTDGLGDWSYALIPPGYSAPIRRTMKVPHYFLENTSFDLAVGVWTAPAELYPNPYTGKLISVTYFKNIGFVQFPKAGQVGNVVKPLSEGLGNLLGIPAAFALALISIIISLVVGIIAGWKIGDGMIAVVVLLTTLLGFTLIGWIPIWFLIILGILAAFLIASFVRRGFTPA